MPRRLIVMRHAKSSWKDTNIGDHGRTLNRRGQREAPLVARCLRELHWVPDAVVSSDSRRTRETWENMVDELSPALPIVFTRVLYQGGIEELRRVANNWDSNWRTVLVLGHNPGWEEVVRVLSGHEEVLKTANAALLDGPDDPWPVALELDWRLERIVRPPGHDHDD
jgi:phosphohistidine phosphatase SixA